MLEVYSTDKIEKLMRYLQSEISRSRLDPILAKIFLLVMWKSRNNNDVILRPKWTFAIPDFNSYLNFYKKFNLLHWNGSVAKFVPDVDLYQSCDIIVNIEDKETIKSIIEIGKEISDFKNFYIETIA